eukprot:m.23964 g.23964  ORF g.23964 m.23964 type:complete len:501 (+) comp28556_c0_seq1:69-1571(+)
MADDIEYNPFFKALQTTFEGVYGRAQADCCTICIPQTASLPKSRKFSQSFIELHVLRPSPYFKGRFITKSKKRGELEFEIEDGMIQGVSGFTEPFKCAILSEELGYNKQYEPFKILVVDRPLDPDAQAPIAADAESRFVRKPEQPSASECLRFLWSQPLLHKVVQDLQKCVSTFNQSYVIVEGYLSHAASKLESFCIHAVQSGCAALQSDSKPLDKRNEVLLQLAVESYIMNGVHHKMFHFVKNVYRQQDESLLGYCRRYHGLTAKDLTVADRLCCPTPEAIVELASLEGHTNPLDKLLCMKQTLELISEAVKSKAESLLGSEGIPSLASDDLIPLLVIVIIQAKCNHLPSILYYVENFHWSTSGKADLGYTVVTFLAAVQFILSTDLSKLMPVLEDERDKISRNGLTSAESSTAAAQPVMKKKPATSKPDNRTTPSKPTSYAIRELPSDIHIPLLTKSSPSRASPEVISTRNSSGKGLGGIIGRLQGRSWEEGASGKLT